MSKLYDNLKLFDPDIAVLYIQETGDRAGAKIHKALAEKLLNQTMKDKVISAKEASSLMQLLAFGHFDKDALPWLIDKLNKIVEVDESFEKGPPSASLSARIAHALSAAVTSQIRFTSPFTHITYSSPQYAAILKLIEQKEIEVIALPASGIVNLYAFLGGGDASYRSDLDRLFVPDWDFEHPPFYALVVHEATHAIQDWLDVDNLFQWDTETDAFVAQAIATYVLKADTSLHKKGEPIEVAFTEIKKLLDKGSSLSGADFDAACKKVRKAVQGYDTYKGLEKVRYAELSKDKKRKRSEAAIFRDLYDAAVKAAGSAQP